MVDRKPKIKYCYSANYSQHTCVLFTDLHAEIRNTFWANLIVGYEITLSLLACSETIMLEWVDNSTEKMKINNDINKNTDHYEIDLQKLTNFYKFFISR